ncbi:unnamed protein product [Oppiella nova]|uniref:Uncharacterized protein n=1 Tax=Oppiella nova TaxID=334625 RepID=A0A7R9M2X5_9ACAR|nr:unnamed protein product [Oppiella nova]CAG2169723.1 unnamed protein product [Oppiella nova]
MSFGFKLVFVFSIVFMVSAKDEIVSNEEIEMVEKKLCDKTVSKESKDKLIDCMEEHLPFLVLEAMDSCIYEALPNALTRDEIQRSLCKSEKTRGLVHSCVQRKHKEFGDIIQKDEIIDKFKAFKICVNSV